MPNPEAQLPAGPTHPIPPEFVCVNLRGRNGDGSRRMRLEPGLDGETVFLQIPSAQHYAMLKGLADKAIESGGDIGAPTLRVAIDGILSTTNSTWN